MEFRTENKLFQLTDPCYLHRLVFFSVCPSVERLQITADKCDTNTLEHFSKYSEFNYTKIKSDYTNSLVNLSNKISFLKMNFQVPVSCSILL
jgi:hypothetical protein